VRRNTPSGGLVGAAPLVVESETATSPSAPQATPGGKHLHGTTALLLAWIQIPPSEMVVLELECAHSVLIECSLLVS
jgi:hypothetical protein